MGARGIETRKGTTGVLSQEGSCERCGRREAQRVRRTGVDEGLVHLCIRCYSAFPFDAWAIALQGESTHPQIGDQDAGELGVASRTG